MVANAIGAGLGLLGSMFGMSNASTMQMLSEKSNKRLQENQAKLNYEYAEKQARNNPTWNRAGLVSAGYNPMLAVQNATSGANASWASGAHADSPIAPDYYSTGISNALDAMRLQNETQQVDSNIKAQQATARNQIAEARNKEAENPFIPRREQKSLSKMDAEITKIRHETDYVDASIENMVKMRELQEKLGFAGVNAQIYSADRAYNAHTYGRDIELAPQKRYNDWASKHPNAASLSETIDRHFGALLGAGAGLGAGLRLGKLKLGKRPVGFNVK